MLAFPGVFKLTDGTNLAALLNAAPAGSEYALVVRNIPSGTQTVGGSLSLNDGVTTSRKATVKDVNTNADPFNDKALSVNVRDAIQLAPGQFVDIGSMPSISGFVTVKGGDKGATSTQEYITHTPQGPDHESLDVSLYFGGAIIDPRIANQGTAAATASAWPIKLTDGTNLATLLNAAPAGTEYGLVVRNIPSGTQPISAVSLPLPTGAALDATLTGGTLKAIARGGAKGSTTAADVTSSASGANHQALDVIINDANGRQAQTDNAGSLQVVLKQNGNFASVTGPDGASGAVAGIAALPAKYNVTLPTHSDDAVNYMQVDQKGRLLVTGEAGMTALKVDGSAVTQPVSGTVTANQGTAAALAAAWGVKVTDGTNTMPTMDAVGRPGFFKITDGTRTVPTEAASSALFVTLWQGSSQLAIGGPNIGTFGGAAQVFAARYRTALPTLTSDSPNPFQLDVNGRLIVTGESGMTALKVDGSAATQPVSGTVTANQGTPASVGNSWNFKLSDATLSLSLLNSAPGSDTGQVAVPVRIISSLAGGSGGTSSNFAAAFPSAGTAAGAKATAVAPTYVDGNMVPFSTDLAGALRITGSISATNPSVGATGVAIPTSATLLGASDGTLLQQLLVESAANRNLRIGIYSGANEATVTGANALKVDGSGVTQPVSGTFWQATQPVSGTFWQATQPISAAALPLPTGAATDSTISTMSGKFTDEVATTSAASETATSRLSVTSALRLLDTSLGAGSQLVAAKGDSTSGLWVNIKNPSVAVTGTFWQATQPVSGTFWQATQPVSGTVTANQGTAAALASAWPVKVTDGTNSMPTMDALARAGFQKITDGVSTATIKAASTLGVATDTALVVAPRPNDIYTIQGNQPAATTGNITAANSVVTMTVNNLNVATVTLTGAAFAGVSFVFEGSPDSGTSWSSLQAARTDSSIIENGSTTVLGNANAPRSWDIPIGGLTNIRVRATAWTSGTATITIIGQVFAYDPCPTVGISGGAGTGPVAVKAASTAAVATDPALVVALSPNNNTTANALFERPRQLVTYSASFRLAVAASQLSLTKTFVANTDVQLATIYHAVGATKTVRIRKISIFVSTGALGVFGFEVRRLSGATAPATGNPAITPGAADSSDGAAEVTCLALPTTAGTETNVNVPFTGHFEWNSAAVAASANPSGLSGQEIVLYDYRQCDERKPLTIRAGVAEGLAVIGRCTTAVALRFTLHVELTEE